MQFPAVLPRPVKKSEELVFMAKKGGSRMERNDGRDGITQVQVVSNLIVIVEYPKPSY